jgi:hypothetical protein
LLPRPGDATETSPLRILVLEDDAIDRKQMERCLAGSSQSVAHLEFAERLSQALEILRFITKPWKMEGDFRPAIRQAVARDRRQAQREKLLATVSGDKPPHGDDPAQSRS